MDYDPELVQIFKDESDVLLQELQGILEKLEEDTQLEAVSKNLELYGQVVDRMMGAAKSLSFNRIGKLCELGKMVGYKSSQAKDENLNQIVIAFLFDATEHLKEMIINLPSSESQDAKIAMSATLMSRLKWLVEKFKHIERGSVAIE
jgi:hypothetical protein